MDNPRPSAADKKKPLRRSFESSRDREKERLNSTNEKIKNIKHTDKHPSRLARARDSIKREVGINPSEHRTDKVNKAIDELKGAVAQLKQQSDDLDYLPRELRSKFVSQLKSVVEPTERCRDQAVEDYGKWRYNRDKRD